MLQIILFLKFDIVLLSSHALSKTLHLATDKSVTSIEPKNLRTRMHTQWQQSTNIRILAILWMSSKKSSTFNDSKRGLPNLKHVKWIVSVPILIAWKEIKPIVQRCTIFNNPKIQYLYVVSSCLYIRNFNVPFGETVISFHHLHTAVIRRCLPLLLNEIRIDRPA